MSPIGSTTQQNSQLGTRPFVFNPPVARPTCSRPAGRLAKRLVRLGTRVRPRGLRTATRSRNAAPSPRR